MANNKWYYPDASNPTTTLEFDVKSHLFEDSDVGISFNQQTGLSKGGTRYVDSFGPNRNTYRFTAVIYVDHATSVDLADIQAFLTTILGSFRSFVWRDENEVDRVVRIIADVVSFTVIPPNYYKFAVTLEVQS